MSPDRLRVLEEESLHIVDAALAAHGRPCVTCSFQSSGVVLLHLLRRRNFQIPVLFLDTMHHFPETLAYRDRMAEAWQLNLITLRASDPLPGLWQVSTDSCC